MALSLREAPWHIQLLIALVLGVAVYAVFEYTPLSPVQQKKEELKGLETQSSQLQSQVAQLQQYKQRYTEFQQQVESLERQLKTLQEIVPEEKEVDEFIRMVQREASGSNVAIRRLTARPLSTREYHVEMPFEFEIDGPYYAVLDFFSRLGRLSRIINVGDLTLFGLSPAKQPRYPVGAGTTVTGTFTATTFFTKGAQGPPAKR
jgi:type IV pilus assembly protein PilO